MTTLVKHDEQVLLATHIGAARVYWREPAVVSPAQLAAFCEPRLRVLPGLMAAEPAMA